MKFIAVYWDGCIKTDDYDIIEILRNEHIKNIEDDIKRSKLDCPIALLDENMNFICNLNNKKVA